MKLPLGRGRRSSDDEMLGRGEMTEIGRLRRSDARQVWPHEAADFTPWLLQNGDALGEVLGMDLELSEAEHNVGRFSLDLIGTDTNTGDRVIIENQLERSDHSHLGQILTYAGGTDARNIVWIADEIRSEHRAALDWLNERTDEQTRFFAVEISAVQIGESAFAPLFEVVVQPNDWQKVVRSSTSTGAYSQTAEMYREFWGLFLDELHHRHPGWTNTRKPLPQSWMTFPTGVSDVKFAAVAIRDFLRVEIYFSSRSREVNDLNFEKVELHKDEIERVFGDTLKWDKLDDKKACRISFSRPGGISNESNWNEQVAWLVDKAGGLRSAIEAVGGMSTLLNSPRGD